MSQGEQVPVAQNAITGQFTLQAQLGNNAGKSFSVTGYIYDGESKESLNQRIDLLHDVADRQRTRAEIPAIEAEVDSWRERLEGNRVHFALLLKKRDAGQKLTTQEKQQLDVMDVNVKEHLRKIEEGEKRLAEMRAKVATP